MPRPDDPLRELRDAWRELGAPPPDRPAGDAAEEASVAWLQEAWSRLEAPPATARRLSRQEPSRRLLHLVPLAAAAAVLVTLSLWHAGTSTEVVESIVADRGAETVPATPGNPGRNFDPEPAPASTELTPAAIELRRGNVRLILLPLQPIHPEDT